MEKHIIELSQKQKTTEQKLKNKLRNTNSNGEKDEEH